MIKNEFAEKHPTTVALQVVVPERLLQAELYSGHLPIMAGHPRTRKIYDNLRRRFSWPHIVTDVDNYLE